MQRKQLANESEKDRPGSWKNLESVEMWKPKDVAV